MKLCYNELGLKQTLGYKEHTVWSKMNTLLHISTRLWRTNWSGHVLFVPTEFDCTSSIHHHIQNIYSQKIP